MVKWLACYHKQRQTAKPAGYQGALKFKHDFHLQSSQGKDPPDGSEVQGTKRRLVTRSLPKRVLRPTHIATFTAGGIDSQAKQHKTAKKGKTVPDNQAFDMQDFFQRLFKNFKSRTESSLLTHDAY